MGEQKGRDPWKMGFKMEPWTSPTSEMWAEERDAAKKIERKRFTERNPRAESQELRAVLRRRRHCSVDDSFIKHEMK